MTVQHRNLFWCLEGCLLDTEDAFCQMPIINFACSWRSYVMGCRCLLLYLSGREPALFHASVVCLRHIRMSLSM